MLQSAESFQFGKTVMDQAGCRPFSTIWIIVKSIHPFSESLLGGVGGGGGDLLEPIPASVGWRRGTPYTGHTFPFTLRHNLESPMNLCSMLWGSGRNLEKTHMHEENMHTPHRKMLPGFEPGPSESEERSLFYMGSSFASFCYSFKWTFTWVWLVF